MQGLAPLVTVVWAPLAHKGLVLARPRWGGQRRASTMLYQVWQVAQTSPMLLAGQGWAMK